MTIEQIKETLEQVNCSEEAIDWAVEQIVASGNTRRMKISLRFILYSKVEWGQSPNFLPDVYETGADYWAGVMEALEFCGL